MRIWHYIRGASILWNERFKLPVVYVHGKWKYGGYCKRHREALHSLHIQRTNSKAKQKEEHTQC